MRSEDSLATFLLVGRLHSQGVKPLKASEYWKLLDEIPEPGALLGQTETRLVKERGFSREMSARLVALLDRARVMAFELESLEHTGIWTVTPFDEQFPPRLVDRLGSKAPTLLHGAGDVNLLRSPGIGVVGSRDVSMEGADVARHLATTAVSLGFSLVSGGARGVDQLAMNAAFQSGGRVTGILADSLVRRLSSPDIRMAIHDDRAVMCSPYGPKAPFRAWNAMGRNKLIYALSEITLVVASVPDKGGTWSGATEALKGGFGRVAVWRGPGEGPGNVKLEELGAEPLWSVEELERVIDRRDGIGREVERIRGGEGSQGRLFSPS